jgi:hypothetical protein
MNMARENTPPKPPRTPWNKLTGVARPGFNLSKSDVEKVKAKYSSPLRKASKEKK